MALSTNDFGKAVVASGLLPADALKSIWESLPADARPKNADAFAKLLVTREKLTPFQATELLSGSGTPLVLGDYVLLAKIGAGGMGQVFKAHHRRMDRLAAIKLLPSAMTKDEAAVKRFEREVKAAAKLSHPNIVHANDASVQRGVWYLVMEYVEGSDLAHVVKSRGPLPVADALNYITQAARGLAFAHSEGVVHRDIKPANLLLDKKGVVKILDMGLARFDDANPAMAAAEEGLTQSGQVMGTVDYMAPEQAFDTRHADARADIYSLGCSLYRLLIGENVYSGDTVMQKFLAHREKPIPSLREKRPEVSTELDAVFQKMMAKLPEDRYQPTSRLVADLEACASGSTAKLAGSAASSTNLIDSPSGKLSATEVEDGMTAALGNQLMRSLPDSHAAPREDTLGSSSDDRTQRGRKGQKTANMGGKVPPWKNPLVLGGAGAAGLLIVLLGIWVIVRDKDGNEVAKVKVPDGGSVKVQEVKQGPSAKSAKKTEVMAKAESPFKVGSGNMPPLAKAPFDAKQAKAYQETWAKHLGTTVETTNSVGQKMILIPPGEFIMGSTDEQVEFACKTEELKNDKITKDHIQNYERPQHKVDITKPLLMSATEVTIGQFRKFVEASKYVTEAEQYGSGDSAGTVLTDRTADFQKKKNWRTPGYDVTDDSPVAQITWNDATAYCQWLSTQEKTTYRLPTEAEWEYACRAGTTTQYSFGDDMALLDQYGWYYKNAGRKSHPVGTKSPNGFGLFDMHGNLSEWCGDFFDEKWYEKSSPNDPIGPSVGSHRVFRGGPCLPDPSYCRSAYRGHHSPSLRNDITGIRYVRVLDAQPPLAKAPFDAAQAKAHQEAWAKHLGTQVEATNSVGAKMVLIPPGEFLMGSSDEQVAAILNVAEERILGKTDKDRIRDAERPQHRVVITKPLLMNATEVTVGQFKKFAAASGYQTEAEKAEVAAKAAPTTVQTYLNPGYLVTDDSPAPCISWNDAVAYCQWLSTQEKATYRLPTEAEWEYACRAGTTTQYSFGDDVKQLEQFGWYDKNAAGKSHPVGTKSPNGFGLFDMHGNLWEWCQDFWDEQWYKKSPVNDPSGPGAGAARVLRGGRWFGNYSNCRSAYRNFETPSLRRDHGFRCVRVLDGSTALTASAPATTASVTPQPVPVAVPGKLFIHDPAFQQWTKDVQALPAEEQWKAVAKKLQELNRGFDGKVERRIENGKVTKLVFSTDEVTDISPVCALLRLQILFCTSRNNVKSILSDLAPLHGLNLSELVFENTQVSDLSPLKGMPLTVLDCSGSKVADLSALRGMTLTTLICGNTPVSDLSPLQGMSLTTLNCGNTPVSDLAPLEGMQLTSLSFASTQISSLFPLKGMPLVSMHCGTTQVSDLSPLRGIKLTALYCQGSEVTDLSPLRGMPLKNLQCYKTKVSDLSPLQDCTSLTSLKVTETKVTPATVAALQKVLPNCKIEWDDPAKATPIDKK